MKNTIFAIITICGVLFSTTVFTQDRKFFGAIQNESDVPEYTLPDLLTTFNGKKITSLKQWEKFRRPEIVKFFEENIYGKVPVPPDPVKTTYTIVSEDPSYMDGLCTRRQINITFSNSVGSWDMHIVTFVPNHIKKPVPSIMYTLSGGAVEEGNFVVSHPHSHSLKVWGNPPIKQMMLRGIGLVGTDVGALFEWDTKQDKVLHGALADLFYHPGQTNINDDEWGMMSIWAYGFSTVLDYLETDKSFHPRQVALLGASVVGKAGMWAAAKDQRVGMVLSCTAGHAGDALWKREFGETLENMCEWLPRWLAPNAQKYKGRVDELPVDQHMMMACVAPRPIFITSGQYDLWADTKGAWLAAYHSIPVYEMYGKKVAFESDTQPAVSEVIMESSIGYNLRTDYHGISAMDWEKYMKFIEYHFLKIKPRSTHEIFYPDGKLIEFSTKKTRL
ncbi:hypothetical protein SAMN05444274_101607 [Mariniphaga anaerophila]|uniref:4-O-methyl-glucuronoyl methylesterase-like domain-containing protein n=1 Tax=Mariniphaga anaerophila TaxID=1484053 RepID=A0A1M4U880_9BACT|nr:hypothetical protein [Mariniphaga anaerophila]SHE52979.1 hypothetical protein SAMN05444274_101607 [Mariniphaga anaerophila]